MNALVFFGVEFGPSGLAGTRDSGEQYEGRHNVLYDNFWR